MPVLTLFLIYITFRIRRIFTHIIRHTILGRIFRFIWFLLTLIPRFMILLYYQFKRITSIRKGFYNDFDVSSEISFLKYRYGSKQVTLTNKGVYTSKKNKFEFKYCKDMTFCNYDQIATIDFNVKSAFFYKVNYAKIKFKNIEQRDIKLYFNRKEGNLLIKEFSKFKKLLV